MINFWEEPEVKKINKKKITTLIIVIVLILIIITVSVIYINNKNIRNWIDVNVFRKEKIQNNLPSIEIEESNNLNIYAFNKYIGILNNNKFKIYGGDGKEQTQIDIDIAKPIFSSEGKYLAIAEEKGKKLYVIEDKSIIWEEDMEGNISQVSINKNGYVAVTIVDTSYKTVVSMFDKQGEPLFKTFLSTTRVVATSISNDNKYLALAEIDTSGTMVQSSVKIISIDEGKSKDNSSDSVKKIYAGKDDELITNIKYQEKDKLICMYTDKIKVIKSDETEEEVQVFGDKKVAFASINMKNSSITVEEKSSGIFTADSVVNIVNSDNKSMSIYTADSVAKEIYAIDETIALNLGSQVEFVNSSRMVD